MEFIAPEGARTESEASAKDIPKIIRQIKAEKVPAVFLENITDSRLLDQISKETGAKIGGTLFSDAPSPPYGPAGTYLDMFRNNIEILYQAAVILIDAPGPQQASGSPERGEMPQCSEDFLTIHICSYSPTNNYDLTPEDGSLGPDRQFCGYPRPSLSLAPLPPLPTPTSGARCAQKSF
jgi:hypothetical protein